MQKKKVSVVIALVIVAYALLSGCKPNDTYIYDGDSKVIISSKSVEETPIEEVAFVLMGKIRDASGYVITGIGTTEASLFKIPQNIKTCTIKNGNEYFFDSESTGFVNSYHQAFFANGKVVYGDGVCSKDEYSEVYGFTPEDVLLCGYTINEVTVIDTKRLNRDGNTYTFKFTLDGEKASNKMKTQMKTFGDLKEEPKFEKLYITAVFDNDWTVHKIIIQSEYKAKRPISVNCTQTIENVFTEFNGQPIIENVQEFRNKLK